MKKKLIFQDPPKVDFNNTKKLTGIKAYLELLKEHPDRWTLYNDSSKSMNYYTDYQRKYPNLMVKVRRNKGKKTFSIYFMWMNDADTAKRQASLWEARATRASKRAHVMENATPHIPTSAPIALPLPVTHE